MRATRKDIEQGLKILADLLGLKASDGASRNEGEIFFDCSYGGYKLMIVRGGFRDFMSSARMSTKEMNDFLTAAIQALHVREDVQEKQRKLYSLQRLTNGTFEELDRRRMTSHEYQLASGDVDKASGHTCAWIEMKQWVLTDGQQKNELRWMVDREAAMLNRIAHNATDGNWWWQLAA